MTRKNTFYYFNRFCLVLARGENFVGGAFEDCPVSGNIYKLCASNHLHHLLGVDDDRIFCYFINSLHIFAESILVLKSRLLTKVTINLIRSAVSDDDGRVFWSWIVSCYLFPFLCLNNVVCVCVCVRASLLNNKAILK